VNEALDQYELGQASWTLYHFLWDEFADWYVELAKPRLRENPRLVREVLLAVLEGSLRLAHPFLPFITEEIWQSLPCARQGEALIVAPYPGAFPELRDQDAETRMSDVIEVSTTIRRLKADLGVPQKVVDVALLGDGRLEVPYIEQSARARVTTDRPEGAATTALAAGVEIAIAVAGLVDVEAEKARAEKELAAIDKEAAGLRGRLSNEQFTARAPAEVVDKARQQLSDLQDRKAKLEERLRSFGA
jgi:valyl-tRNA synthetase